MVESKQSCNDNSATADTFGDGLLALGNLFSATQCYLGGMSRYTTDFFIPYMLATQYFKREEALRLQEASAVDNLEAYLHLLQNNFELITRSVKGTADMMTAYAQWEIDGLTEALKQSWFEQKHDKLLLYTGRQVELMEMVAHDYPRAIDEIEPEFGFHFERGEHLLADETDRFLLYRIAPSLKHVKMRHNAKPVLIIPPFVLGANILGFLPGEQRSYAHCFANQGFPTYIRVLKDIDSSPALQVMTGEDDAKDTRRFCETIVQAHGKRVSLNGYCQGGFSALCNLLSGELDGLVDAFITCVAPMDGTRSKGLSRFLTRLPQRFNDLAYGTKTLPNGNQVADGKLMGWVYKLKSIEHEIPAAAFFRDVLMFARQKKGENRISKTAAAMNYWLRNERYDLPLEITRMSYASYNVPITADGTLPVKLFGQKLNLKRLTEKKIPWLICYGIHDDLVEKETALAPLDYVKAEVTPFPKGHVAIATSWSSPDSDFALHTRFGENNHRGPVLFHMDLDEVLTEAAAQTPGTTEVLPITPSRSKARSGPQIPGKKAPAARRPSRNTSLEKTSGSTPPSTETEKSLTETSRAKTTPAANNKRSTAGPKPTPRSRKK